MFVCILIYSQNCLSYITCYCPEGYYIKLGSIFTVKFVMLLARV